ncbi:hypothetical protein J1N35_023351 [Gossypium stocksii]|uniref:Uncharacterized protein n=1 Tax=Gossypium stocksii TaxID=47602 RepID=A0A9D4A3U0_9ROSI|nr:hypothetical protein J1N35_023351 [Gossypium stocksii]
MEDLSLSIAEVTVGREEFETVLRSLRGKKANVFKEATSIIMADVGASLMNKFGRRSLLLVRKMKNFQN